MIARWRAFAHLAVFVGLVYCAASASAATILFLTSGPVELVRDAAEILAGIFAVVMGFMAFSALFTKLFVLPVTNAIAAKHQAMISEGLAELGRGFEALMDRHIQAGEPHPTAAYNHHLPLKEDIGTLRHEVDLLADRAEEIAGAYSALAARCPVDGCGPIPSLAPRHRKNVQPEPDKSGDDYRAMRKT